MAHGHSHRTRNYNKAFAIGVALNLGFVLVEAVYGVLAESLALIADAGHNLSDVLGLVLAWGASFLATKSPTQRRTYGFRRVTILASLTSGVLLLVAVGAISWEAIGRFSEPKPVDGMTVIVVAAIGVAINTATALMFMSGRHSDLNIKGAFLHMAADAGVSLGVVISGLLFLTTGWLWLDPTISMLIAAVVFLSAWGLLREAFGLAIDSVPRHIDPEKVKDYLLTLPSVVGLHDLHIWAMSTTEAALTAHLEVQEINVENAFCEEASNELQNRFGIGHTTLQLEKCSDGPCRLAQADSV